MSPFRKVRSSLCVSRIVSIRVCLLCICHCIRNTNPKIIRVIVINSPNIHSSVSNLLFISERRSSIRLLRPLSKLSIRLSRLFCPSSSLVSLSTISLSLILGACSTAISREGINIPIVIPIMIITFFISLVYHLKIHNVNLITLIFSHFQNGNHQIAQSSIHLAMLIIQSSNHPSRSEASIHPNSARNLFIPCFVHPFPKVIQPIRKASHPNLPAIPAFRQSSFAKRIIQIP